MNEDFELDKKLYEVSKWQEASQRWCYIDETGEGEKWVLKLGCPSKEFHDIPHYDLEYLLDRLKITADWTHGRFDLSNYCDTDGVYEWAASYNSYDNDFPIGRASSPRQAALKLAIELFKQDILKPAGEGV